ncbi:MAG: alpha-amylase, partial [Rhodospirillales bacterium]|nr:alpha-amylase [Rhodospirillales bacterium]
DIRNWSCDNAALAAKTRTVLERVALSATLDEAAARLVERILDDWPGIEHRCEVPAEAFAGTVKTRIHGDLHLGQVVVAGTDFYILDFEGEPMYPLAQRRAKSTPLRDVAGIIRSFDYAGSTALVRRNGSPAAGEATAAYTAIAQWRAQTTTRFLASYREATAGCPSVPQSAAAFPAALQPFLLAKALYEVWYEAANRPGWLAIPLTGILRLLDSPFASE